jgi:hypothetical protein
MKVQNSIIRSSNGVKNGVYQQPATLDVAIRLPDDNYKAVSVSLVCSGAIGRGAEAFTASLSEPTDVEAALDILVERAEAWARAIADNLPAAIARARAALVAGSR